MSRIRTIKPAFFRDLTIAELPLGARLTYIGLWTHADDQGRAVDDPRLIKADVWPLDDAYTSKKVAKDIDLLITAGRVCRYQHEGASYIHVIKWNHQRIDHPQPSPIHPCPIHERSTNDPGTIKEQNGQSAGTFDERSTQEGKGIEGKGKGREGRGTGREGNAGRTGNPPGRRPASGNEQTGPASAAALEAARAIDTAKAEACDRGCDHGWLIDGDRLTRCPCQTAAAS